MSDYKTAYREDITPAALCLNDAPLAVAMRQAWEEMGTGPFPVWTPDTAQAWPHPEWAFRQRFHERTNEILYQQLDINPHIKPTTDGPVPGIELMPVRFSKEQLADIVHRYAVLRESMRTIAAALGVSETPVRKALRRQGVAIRANSEQPTYAARQHEYAAEVRRLNAEGRTDVAIAAALGLTWRYVARIRRTLNLPPVTMSAAFREAHAARLKAAYPASRSSEAA